MVFPFVKLPLRQIFGTIFNVFCDKLTLYEKTATFFFNAFICLFNHFSR